LDEIAEQADSSNTKVFLHFSMSFYFFKGEGFVTCPASFGKIVQVNPLPPLTVDTLRPAIGTSPAGNLVHNSFKFGMCI
jgi:hypothetical protein